MLCSLGRTRSPLTAHAPGKALALVQRKNPVPNVEDQKEGGDPVNNSDGNSRSGEVAEA